jgi:hypothetical protein
MAAFAVLREFQCSKGKFQLGHRCAPKTLLRFVAVVVVSEGLKRVCLKQARFQSPALSEAEGCHKTQEPAWL